jgi:hypothetical protein
MAACEIKTTAITVGVVDLIHDFNTALRTTEPEPPRLSPLDEPTPEPRFHRLLELPLEIRYEIYEHYFCNELRSLACKTWQTAGRTYIRGWQPSYERTLPFLPTLCLVSYAMLKEATKLLLRNTHIKIDGYFRVNFIQKMNKCRMLALPERVRTLMLPSITFAGPEPVYEGLISQSLRLGVVNSIRLHNQLLSRCSNVRTLHLTFWTPHSESPPDSPRPLIALPIDKLIMDFDPQPVWNMENLQELWLVGRCEHTVTEEEKAEDRPLQGVMSLAGRLQDGFRGLTRAVEITVRLYHSEHELKRVL